MYPEIMEHVNSIVLLDCKIKLSCLPSHFQKLPTVTHQHMNLQSPTFTFQMPFLHHCARDFYELTGYRAKRILELLAKGYKFAEIVEETGLSLNTIRTHIKKAYQKLNANNSSDAIVRAKQLGIVK